MKYVVRLPSGEIMQICKLFLLTLLTGINYKTFKFKIGVLRTTIAQKQQISGFYSAHNMLLGLNE